MIFPDTEGWESATTAAWRDVKSLQTKSYSTDDDGENRKGFVPEHEHVQYDVRPATNNHSAEQAAEATMISLNVQSVPVKDERNEMIS